MTGKRRSLQTHLAAIVAVTTFVVATISSGLVYHYQVNRSEDESRALVKSLIATVYKTAAIAAYANNQPIGQDAIDGLLKNEVVQWAELTGDEGLHIVSKRDGATGSSNVLVQKLSSPFSDDDVVGSLKVEPNRAWIQAKAQESALTMVAWMAGLVVATALISMVVIRRTLTNPLASVARELQGITPGQSAQLAIPKQLERNEVGDLVQGVNDLLGKVYQAIELERDLRRQVEATDAQLREAMGKTEAAAKAKEDFLASMSHEIRTPLNGVIGTLDLLTLSQLDESQREQVTAMRDAAGSLLGIINDILDFSKIEAGKLDIHPEPINLHPLLESIVHLYRDTASSKSLTLDLKMAGIDKVVLCDPLRIRQIVSNLIGNALKFTERGGVTVKVRGLPKAGHQLQIRIDVTDTGIGIDPQSQGKVFSAFSQAEANTTKRFGGTGLGLAICKRLCELMGGTISLKSMPGKGSTFSVELGLDLTDQAPKGGDIRTLTQHVPPTVRPLLSVEQAEAAGVLIGVVDDHPINRFVLSKQLATLGYTSVAAEDGVQALAMSRKHRLALLITDCQMPNMDGYQLAQAIRADEADQAASSPVPNTGRPLPILACTAAALQGEAEKCQAAGMSDYMTKPLQVPILAAMLQKWLPAPQPVDAALAPPPINQRFWEEQTNGEHDIKEAVASQFIDTTRTDLAAFKEALHGDAAQAKALLHRIKGSALSVGAEDLGHLCERLQAADTSSVKALLPQLDAAVEAAASWLERDAQHPA